MFPLVNGSIMTWHRVRHGLSKKSLFTLFCCISPKIENEELKKAIKYGENWRKSKKLQGIYCSIDGFNDDIRELNEIPEARAFCSRLCISGFISMLGLSTTCEQLFDSSERLPIARDGITLGALELFLISKGLINRTGRIDFGRDVFEEFDQALLKANEVAEKLSAD